MKHMEESIKPPLRLHPTFNPDSIFNQDHIQICIAKAMKNANFGCNVFSKKYPALPLRIDLPTLRRVRKQHLKFIGWTNYAGLTILYYSQKRKV